MATVQELADAVAARLNADPAEVLGSAEAAVLYVTELTATELLLPDNGGPLVWRGLDLLTERIFLDTGTPSGGIAAAGDPTFGGVYVPEDLSKHLHHYWDSIAVEAPVY